MTVPEKVFVDKGLLFCGSAEKEELPKNLFTVVFKEGETGFPYIKRCRIEQYINNKDYLLVPDGSQILLFSTDEDFEFTVVYAPKPRMKVKEEAFRASDFEERGLKAQGVRLAAKESVSAQLGVTKLAKKAAASAASSARAQELFPVAPAKGKKGILADDARVKAKSAGGKTKAGAKKPAPAASSKKGLKARAEEIAARRKRAASKKTTPAKKPIKKR